MAVGVGVNRADNARYNGKITGSVLLSCFLAATGGMLFGYDTEVTGGVTSMDPFLKNFFPGVYNNMNDEELAEITSNYCKFDSQLLTSSIYISGLFASFLASRITRQHGRKRSILIGGVTFLLGAAIMGSAQGIYMLIFGRLLIGVGVGFANQAVPLYLSEMALSKHRGSFDFGFQAFLSFGSTSAFLINYATSNFNNDWSWRISLATAVAPASILVVGTLFFLPETPNSLIQQGRDPLFSTTKVLQFDDLFVANKKLKHLFKKILTRSYRPYLVMAVAIPFFQQMTGITFVSFYAPILFRTIGSDESSSLMSSLIAASLGTVSTLVSSLLVDKVGRRAVFIFGGVQMFVCQMLIGGILAGKLGDQGSLSHGYNVTIVVLICIVCQLR